MRWVAEYNTARPHQSCGRRPPIERFRLADRSLAADGSAAAEPAPAVVPGAPRARRPAGVSRWVNAAGKISLAGFTYHVGATYAGEPVEVVVTGGLVDILHAGVVVATHAQRLRARPGRPRAPGPGLPAGTRCHRRADRHPAGQQHRRDHLRRQDLRRRPALGAHLDRRDHRRRIGPAVQGRHRSSASTPSATTGPRNSAPSPTPKAAPAGRTPPPATSPKRSCRPGTGTLLSPRNRNLTQVIEQQVIEHARLPLDPQRGKDVLACAGLGAVAGVSGCGLQDGATVGQLATGVSSIRMRPRNLVAHNAGHGGRQSMQYASGTAPHLTRIRLRTGRNGS